MQTLKLFNSLCAPAQLYLGMSILAVLVQCYQNIGNPNVFACGLMKANSPINNDEDGEFDSMFRNSFLE